MKKNILLAVILLSSGLQMAAKDRDLIGMRNFRELSNIPYDQLTPKEKQDVYYMAFRSGLLPQRSAARNLINKKFNKLSEQEWKMLENMATNEGLNQVNAYFAAKLTGGSRAPSPAGVPASTPTPAAASVAPQPQQMPQAQQKITALPQDSKNLMDELAKLALEYDNKGFDKDDMTQELLKHANGSITDGSMTRDVAIDGMNSFLQQKIDGLQQDLADAKQRIAEYKKELANLGVGNADIEKIHDDGFRQGGYNQAAHDLHRKMQDMQIQQQQPAPLLNVPANLP